MKELPSEEEEIPFRIKTYKKKELACMYNPNITPRCAIRIFTKWIKINKELLRLLNRLLLWMPDQPVKSCLFSGDRRKGERLC